jgi:methyl acetate hydrolase
MRAQPTKGGSRFGVYLPRGTLAAALATALGLTSFPDGWAKSSNPIDQVLQGAVAKRKLPGVVAMVSVPDRIAYQGAAGKRDTIKNIPITLDSIFRIASMTKPITSLAVMQLVESGRVKLDEPAATYLPELTGI